MLRRCSMASAQRSTKGWRKRGACRCSASPPAPGGKRSKLRYITQIKSRPPSFVVFGSRLDELPESYRRYLVNGIRRELGFGAVPVRLTLRSSKNPFAKKD